MLLLCDYYVITMLFRILTNIIPSISNTYPIYPMLIPYASFGQVPIRFQSGSNEVPMEVRGK